MKSHELALEEFFKTLPAHSITYKHLNKHNITKNTLQQLQISTETQQATILLTTHMSFNSTSTYKKTVCHDCHSTKEINIPRALCVQYRLNLQRDSLIKLIDSQQPPRL